jgi:hypothetical protein
LVGEREFISQQRTYFLGAGRWPMNLDQMDMAQLQALDTALHVAQLVLVGMVLALLFYIGTLAGRRKAGKTTE